MDLNLLFYFLASIVQDFLITLNWRYVTKHRAVMASIFSFMAIFVYALGIGV